MADEFLYTGATSSRPRTRKEVQNQDKLEKQAKLAPFADLVFEQLEKEKTKASDVSNFLTHTGTDLEELKADLLARKQYVAYLTQLQNTFKVILKAKPTKQKVEDEDE
jgi:hypothetical protein